MNDFVKAKNTATYDAWQYLGQDEIPDSVLMRLAKNKWWAGFRPDVNEYGEGTGESTLVIGSVNIRERMSVDVTDVAEINVGDWICFGKGPSGEKDWLSIRSADEVEPIEDKPKWSEWFPVSSSEHGSYKWRANDLDGTVIHDSNEKVVPVGVRDNVSIVEGMSNTPMTDHVDIPHKTVGVDAPGVISHWLEKHTGGSVTALPADGGIELFRRIDRERFGKNVSVIPNGSLIMLPSENDRRNHPRDAVNVIVKGRLKEADSGDQEE